MNPQLQQAISHVEELKDEFDSNKKLREKMDAVITILSNGEELAIEKSLMVLEDLNSLNLPAYHRTQLWDLVSLLESLKK